MRSLYVLGLVLLFGFMVSAGSAAAGEGNAIYDSMKCGMCHKPDKKTAAVSLAEIVKTYQDKEKLLKFFNGETKPLIESEKWGMMRGQLTKIQGLSEQEKKDLAEYIMNTK